MRKKKDHFPVFIVRGEWSEGDDWRGKGEDGKAMLTDTELNSLL